MSGIYHIELDAGANYSENFQWLDETKRQVNLAGYAATLTIKNAHTDTVALLTLNNAAGIGIAAAASANAQTQGEFNIAITAAQSAQNNLANQGGRTLNIEGRIGRAFLYDLVFTAPGGMKTRLIQGDVRVWTAVT